jgi:hypothetical protein
VLLAHYAAELPHEFVPSFAARVTGIKADPWDIHWGGGGIGNALLLYNIDEKIDYEFAYAGGHGLAVAIAMIAGPGTNGLLYLVAGFALPWWRTSSSPSIAYLAFWFLFMQLANLYDYVPIRVAASDGDVRQWIRATSPLLDCSRMTAQSRTCSSRVPHTGRHPGQLATNRVGR